MSDTGAAGGPPALAPAAPPPLPGPPPLEGGPPPLEDAPGTLPPGLTAKPKPPPLAPPPLEPPPLPLAPAASSAAPPSSASTATPAVPVSASPEETRAAIIDWLRKKPGSKGLLTQLGVYLRSRKLAPDGPLKRFLQQHCQGRVVLHETKTGTDSAQLAEAAARERTAAFEQERAAAAAPPPPPPPQPAVDANRPASAGDNYDPSWLEQQLMQFCVSEIRRGVQPALPALGQFCIQQLGLQMRGKLRPFLDRRTALCTLSDDGRQHVSLTPAGMILGGATPGESSRAPADAPQPQPGPLARLSAGQVPGSGPGYSGDAQQSTAQVAAAVLPGVAAAHAAVKDYKKWDALTKEIFQFVRAHGVATFNQIDAHIKSSPQCAKQIAMTGIPLVQWRSQFFLHKRRNVFRLNGPVVSLINHIPETADDSASEASASPPADEFPPLPSAASGGAAPSAGSTPAGPSPAVPTGVPAAGGDGAAGSASPTPSAAAAAAGSNPLLAAFAAERQKMEQLRDDMQTKLASFKALSELQKENAGLRAACVTLGRELLSLKNDFTAFQQQTAAALAAVQAGGAVTAPAVEGVPSISALQSMLQQQQQQQQADAAYGHPAAGDMSQQQWQQHAAAPAASPSSGAAPALAPASEAAQGVQQPALPLHMPASAPVVAAPALPSVPVPKGEIVLVGGHDGGTWLDSVDYFAPRDCVWASLPLLGKPRSFAAAVATPSEVFVAGGGNGMEWYDSVVCYDRQAGLMGGWRELAPLQVPRGSLAAGISGGYLFVYGGGKPKEQYNVVEWYDPQSDRWLPGPSLQRKRFALGGAALDGAIYAVGGYDGTGYLACTERLDPRTDRWELLPGGMATKRGGHSVASAAGCLYALGGFDGAQAMPHCEVFEPRINSWRTIADMSDCRAYGSCASLGGTVFAVGGLQSDMQTHAVLIEQYNPVADEWEHLELPPNANPRRSFLAACGLE